MVKQLVQGYTAYKRWNSDSSPDSLVIEPGDCATQLTAFKNTSNKNGR